MTYTSHTLEQISAINLVREASTQEEKSVAFEAIKLAFPGKPEYLIKWSDGTISR